MKLFLSDPALALRCLFGPCTPSQYRLMGPGSWIGAKKAIENARSNTMYAVKTRDTGKSTDSTMMIIFILVVGIILAMFAIKFLVY